jgi:hypothetical protein
LGNNEIDFALIKSEKPVPNTPMKEEISGGGECPPSDKSFLPHIEKNRPVSLIFLKSALHYTWFAQRISEEVAMRHTLIAMIIVLLAASAVPLFAERPAMNYGKIEYCHSGRSGGHGHGNHGGNPGTRDNSGSGKGSNSSQSGGGTKTQRDKK